VASPLNTKPKAAPTASWVRVSLVNFSVSSRQLVLPSGQLNLPVGVRVDIDTHVGATLTIVSSTDDWFREEIVIKKGDDAQYIDIH
jgi:hypothetical protein